MIGVEIEVLKNTDATASTVLVGDDVIGPLSSTCTRSGTGLQQLEVRT